MNNKTQQPHIAIIPTPGVGHLIPLTELARQLTESFNFTITILIPNDGTPPSNSQLNLLQSLPNSISHIFLSPVDLTDVDSNVAIETRISLTLTRSIPAIRDSFRVLSESTRLVALVVDLFGPPIFGLAHEFGILPYMFFLSSALGLCLGLSFPKIDEAHKCEYKDLPEPLRFFPGSVPINGADFPDPVQDRKKEVYKEFLELVKGFGKAAGIFVNSFFELEPVTLKYLMEDGRLENNFPPVYHIGPIIRTGLESELEGSRILDWLNEQPINSVLFVSFGSGGHLSHEQLIELALGLELSGQRFLWVVKTPHDQVNASYFGINNGHSPLEYLPEGFIDRTKGLGLVVPSWAPQVEILSHRSIGGFVSHCGWNSILESIVHGMPLITWPLYAKQRLNAVLVAEELGVGLRIKSNDKGLIPKERIAQYAKCLMVCEQGNLLREKMRVLKNAACMALNNGGSSKQSLTKVVEVLMSHKKV